MSKPRIVLTGDDWRVVALELPDQHGIFNTHHVVERIEGKDALDQPIWRKVDTSYKAAAVSDLAYMMNQFLKLLTQPKEQ